MDPQLIHRLHSIAIISKGLENSEMQLISILSLFLLLTSKVQIGLQEDDNGYNGDDGDAGDDDGDASDGDDGDNGCQCTNNLEERPTGEGKSEA